VYIYSSNQRRLLPVPKRRLGLCLACLLILLAYGCREAESAEYSGRTLAYTLEEMLCLCDSQKTMLRAYVEKHNGRRTVPQLTEFIVSKLTPRQQAKLAIVLTRSRSDMHLPSEASLHRPITIGLRGEHMGDILRMIHSDKEFVLASASEAKVELDGNSVQAVGKPLTVPGTKNQASVRYFVFRVVGHGLTRVRFRSPANGDVQTKVTTWPVLVATSKTKRLVTVTLLDGGHYMVRDSEFKHISGLDKVLEHLKIRKVPTDQPIRVLKPWPPHTEDRKSLTKTVRALHKAGYARAIVPLPWVNCHPLAETAWGKESGGVRIRFDVRPQEAAPGESFRLWGYIANTTTKPLRVPGRNGRWWRTGELTMTTPDGRTWMYNVGIHGPGRVLTPAWPPQWCRDSSHTLTATHTDQWCLVDGNTEERPNLRKPGKYVFRWTMAAGDEWVPKADDGAAKWAGTATAPEAVLHVRDRSVNHGRKDLTVGQLDALAKILRGPPKDHSTTRMVPEKKLFELAMHQADNRALAKRAVAALKGRKDGYTRSVLAYSLWRRFVTGDDLGINGPAFKPYAHACMEQVERAFAKGKAGGLQVPLRSVLVYLKHHNDAELRKRAIVLGRKYARLPKRKFQDPVGPGYHRWPSACRILADLGVLNGITLEEAERILGPPTRRKGKYVTWRHDSQMHVNPYVYAVVEDGKVVSLSVGH
jgi:hypothetical protein